VEVKLRIKEKLLEKERMMAHEQSKDIHNIMLEVVEPDIFLVVE